MRRQTIYLTDESKSCLLKHINNSPGIRYRELQRATGFANGVLAYHLKILEKSRRIKVNRYRTRKSTRYYPLNTTAQESRIMEYVRRTTTRKILLFLLDHDRCTSNDIMQHTKKEVQLFHGTFHGSGKHGLYQLEVVCIKHIDSEIRT